MRTHVCAQSGKTVIDMARERGYFDLVEMLVRTQTWRGQQRAHNAHVACGRVHPSQELHTVDERMKELSHTAGVRLIQELAVKATKEKKACLHMCVWLVLCEFVCFYASKFYAVYSCDHNN